MGPRLRPATTAPVATGQRTVRARRWSAITIARACATTTHRSPGTRRIPRAARTAAAVRTISRARGATACSIASPRNSTRASGAKRVSMPKIKHIALSTQDVENTAKFYVETFGMKEVGKVNDPGTRGVFLTDGDINLAILTFKNDAAAGVERGKGFS